MIATQFSGLSFLSNWRTKITYFLITPLIDLMLLVLINLQYTKQFDWRVVIASIAIDAARLSMQTMNQLLVNDSDLRVDFELIAKRPFSLRFWLAKSLVAGVIGTTLALINLLLTFCFGAPLSIICRGLFLLPLFCLYGTVLGFATWALSWQMNDPYFLQNIVSGITEIAAGILIVITAYPKWLQLFALLLPYSSPVNFIKFGTASLGGSAITTAIWLAIGLLAYVLQIRPVLARGKHRY
ncbi:antibiotic transporter permease [Lactobacillus xylocopicola]|uniref:Antibiotic transporter permease n=1 Tax=Lactobacillus xylocopicola TaxID=2976676 RepID=A0ABN6SL01_9LACO|nr:antibiotic transporter permease [Lactobacillus xylocopicola]BDR60299.1 hypothetical protein KIM322_05600 [Lactobacillus xylocopicola]